MTYGGYKMPTELEKCQDQLVYAQCELGKAEIKLREIEVQAGRFLIANMEHIKNVDCGAFKLQHEKAKAEVEYYTEYAKDLKAEIYRALIAEAEKYVN